MSKKASGLGRGLGDLLNDNAPELKGSGSAMRRDEDGIVNIAPEATDSRVVGESSDVSLQDTSIQTETETVNPEEKIEENTVQAPEKPLFEELPRSRSLKSLFREYK